MFKLPTFIKTTYSRNERKLSLYYRNKIENDFIIEILILTIHNYRTVASYIFQKYYFKLHLHISDLKTANITISNKIKMLSNITILL